MDRIVYFGYKNNTHSSNVNSPYLSDNKYLFASTDEESFPYFNLINSNSVSRLKDPLMCA